MTLFPHPTVWRSPEDLFGERILAIAPHPDDETIGYGGCLAMHVERGDAVKIVIATDGRRGDYNGKFDPHLYIALRQQECQRATSILGVSDVEFWKFADGTLSEDTNFIPQLTDCINTFEPNAIYFPSPFEIHPDHLATAEAVIKSINKTSLNPILLMGEIGEMMIYNLLVAVDSVYPKKRSALKCYTSQLQYLDIDVMNAGENHVRTANFLRDKKYAEAFIKTDKKRAKNIINKIYSLRNYLL